jgi:hypothetical protein
VCFGQLHAQTYCENYCLDFLDSTCLEQLLIEPDTGNLWQIGAIQKPVINTGLNDLKAIITDTLNAYPVKNHSVFTITNIASFGDIYGMKMFRAAYFVHSDSLKDYGTIEFSPDNGTTWIDLVNDTTHSSSIIWYSNPPVLTGRSGHWKGFEVLLADNGSVFNLQLGDTIKYRFTFTSDSIQEQMDGLSFDNICFLDFVEGISETRFSPIKSKIFPNPLNDQFTIEFENPDGGNFELAIYTMQSKLVMTEKHITNDKISLGASGLPNGFYVYKLTNLKDKKRSWGKFEVLR